jgi:hypothetical protein
MQCRDLEVGGHCAAMETPGLLVEETETAAETP